MNAGDLAWIFVIRLGFRRFGVEGGFEEAIFREVPPLSFPGRNKKGAPITKRPSLGRGRLDYFGHPLRKA